MPDIIINNINSTLTAIVSMIVVLGIMVLVHEWGHFVAARRFGVRVEIFSIGFGPRLWGRKKGDPSYRGAPAVMQAVTAAAAGLGLERGDRIQSVNGTDVSTWDDVWRELEKGGKGSSVRLAAARAGGALNVEFALGSAADPWDAIGLTDHRISALPLGGYVKMAGDNPSEDRSGASDEFLSKPRWQRAIIALAGPAMNIVTAYVLLVLLFGVIGIPYPAYWDSPAVVAGVGPRSPAAKAGIQPGDKLVDVDGVTVGSWKEALRQLDRLSVGGEASFKFQRGDQTFAAEYPIGHGFDAWDALGYPDNPVEIEEVTPRMPASLAGILAGDKIISIDGTPIVSWEQCVAMIRGSRGAPIAFAVKRGEETHSITVKPLPGRPDRGENTWVVGFGNKKDFRYERIPFVRAVTVSAQRSAQYSGLIAGVIGQLFTGKASLREMSGVIGIAQQSGQAAKKGLPDFVQLMAAISLNLAILNLLPIPILDGGHILLLAIEGIRRRDLSLQVKERFVQVGMVFLLVIFVIVMYNDVLRLLPVR